MSITHASTSLVVAHVSYKTRFFPRRIPSHLYEGSETHHTPQAKAPMPRYLAPIKDIFHLFYSTKFRNFVISSSNSCRSGSEILFARLGMSVLASSADSQQRLPIFVQDQLPLSLKGVVIRQIRRERHEPSCDLSNSSSSVFDVNMRSTASIFSFCLKRAKTSR